MKGLAKELAKQRQRKEALRERHERERRLMTARQRAERAECDERLKELEAQARREGIEPRKQRSAAIQAGPQAIDRVFSFVAGGPITQKEIGRVTGMNPGTVSNALRALLEAGLIRETRRQVFEGSREFQMAAKGRRRRAA